MVSIRIVVLFIVGPLAATVLFYWKTQTSGSKYLEMVTSSMLCFRFKVCVAETH